MLDDAHLLRHFVEDRSEEAFARIVERHIGIVFHSAKRQLGDHTHLAQDVAQSVFIVLAERAPSLLGHPSLVGWLYTTTRHKVCKLLESERRRRAREQVVVTMQDLHSDSEAQNDWDPIRPHLDEALLGLGETDRMAILLRFFEGRAFAEIGSHLSLSEKAANKRVARALERLRSRLLRRGITSSAAALATALGAHAGSTVPAGLAANVTGLALASASSAGSLSSVSLGFLRLAGAARSIGAPVGLLGVAAVIATGVIALTVHEARANRLAHLELATARREVDFETAELQALKGQEQSAESALSGLLAKAGRAGTGAPDLQRHAISADFRTAAPPGSKARDPFEEGRRFVRSYPRVQALFMQLNESVVLERYGPFFRLANLSSSQIARFDEIMASDWISELAVTPTQMGLGPVSDRTKAQLDAVVGPQAAQTLHDYEQNLLYPYKFESAAAAAASEAGVPLSDQQCDQLAQTIASHASAYQPNPNGMGLGYINTVAAAVNWDAVLAEAKATLSSAQFSAVEGALLNVQLQGQLTLAQGGQAEVAGKTQ